MALTAPLGASSARRATVEAFIETRFKLADGTVVRPDGMIQIAFGTSLWRALLEVKTGDNALDAEQVNSYLVLAREQGLDAVITISNEIAAGTDHPTGGVRQRTNARVRLAHYSWTELLAVAVRTKVHRGVADPEQAWILGELIRYLEHSASGAMAFDDMGRHWATVRDGAREGTLRRGAEEVRDVVQRWDQLMRFAALKLGADIGVDVQHVVPRSQHDPRARMNYLVDSWRFPTAAIATVACGFRRRALSTSRVAARCACQSSHAPPTMTTSATTARCWSSSASSSKRASMSSRLLSSPGSRT